MVFYSSSVPTLVLDLKSLLLDAGAVFSCESDSDFSSKDVPPGSNEYLEDVPYGNWDGGTSSITIIFAM